jgi:hypothetical protein
MFKASHANDAASPKSDRRPSGVGKKSQKGLA